MHYNTNNKKKIWPIVDSTNIDYYLFDDKWAQNSAYHCTSLSKRCMDECLSKRIIHYRVTEHAHNKSPAGRGDVNSGPRIVARIVKVKGKADLDRTDRITCVMLIPNLNLCPRAYNSNSKRTKLKLTDNLSHWCKMHIFDQAIELLSYLC